MVHSLKHPATQPSEANTGRTGSIAVVPRIRRLESVGINAALCLSERDRQKVTIKAILALLIVFSKVRAGGAYSLLESGLGIRFLLGFLATNRKQPLSNKFPLKKISFHLFLVLDSQGSPRPFRTLSCPPPMMSLMTSCVVLSRKADCVCQLAQLI